MKSPTTSERDSAHRTHLETARGADLKGQALRAGGVAMVAQGVSLVVRISSIAILARLLSPDTFGLIALVLPVTNFVVLFANLGLTDAVVQRKDLTHEEVSSVFWVNLVLSVVIAAITCAAAPLVAGFYGRPELLGVTLVLSLGVVFGGLAALQLAILRRQMRMKRLAVAQVGSLIAGLAVGVLAALNSADYWALVYSQLAISFFSILLGWMLCGWRPSFAVRTRGIGPLMKFGLDVIGFNLINYMARNLDKILLGRYSGVGVLGLYSRAYQVIMFPIINLRGPINSVALPVFSRLQGEPERFRAYYGKLIQMLGFFSIPLMTFCAVCAGEMVLLIFGEAKEWSGMETMFMLLALCGVIQPVASIRGMVLISLGQTRRYLWWGVANAVAVSLGAVVGVRWGGVGIAAAYAIVNYVILLPSLAYCFQKTSIKVSDFCREIALPLAGSGLFAIAVICLKGRIESWSLIPSIALLGVVSGLVYLVPFCLLPRGREILRQLISYAGFFLKRKSGSAGQSASS